MTDVLTPDEIARLFEAAKDGSLPAEQARSQSHKPSVQRVDFSRPAILSQSELRRLEKAHTAFCRSVSDHLARELRTNIELEMIGSSQLTWGAALEDVPRPSLTAVAECAEGEAIALCMEQPLLVRMIERMLGGEYQDTTTPRELTPVDEGIARLIFEGVLESLAPIWKELLGSPLELVAVGLPKTKLEHLAPFEPTVVLTIEVRDLGGSSTMLLLVPRGVLELASRALGAHPAETGDEAQAAAAGVNMAGVLSGVRVPVRAELGGVDLTIEEVLSFGEGDLVRLGPAGEIEVSVGERVLLRAHPGLSGRNRAMKILEAVEESA